MEALKYVLLFSAFLFSILFERIETEIVVSKKRRVCFNFFLFSFILEDSYYKTESTALNKNSKVNSNSPDTVLIKEILSRSKIYLNEACLFIPAPFEYFYIISSLTYFIVSTIFAYLSSVCNYSEVKNNAINIKQSEHISYNFNITLTFFIISFLTSFISSRIQAVMNKRRKVKNVRI